MSDPTSLTVPDAGWYADRNDANTVRWWDGGQWTEHTHSIAPEQNVAQPVSAAAFGFTPVEPNPLATVAATPATLPSAGQPAAGWYPDHVDPSIQRWWDGTQWTSHTAPGAAMPTPDPTPGSYLGASTTPVVAYGAAFSGGTRSASNTTATLAMIFSLASIAGLIFAPLLLLAVAGIVAGIVALRRVRLYAPPGGRRGQAIAGIVVGGASLIGTILLTVAAVAVYQQVHDPVGTQAGSSQSQPPADTGSGNSVVTFPSTVDDLKVKIADSVSRQNDGIGVKTVTCDGAAAMVSGSIFQCGVIVDDGRFVVVGAQIGRPAASGMAFGLSFGPLTTSDAAPSPVAQTLDGVQQALTVDLGMAWDSPLGTIACDPGASTALGSRFRCGVVLQNGKSGMLMVTIVNPGGFDVTVVQPPEGAAGSNGSGGSGSDSPNDPDVSHS